MCPIELTADQLRRNCDASTLVFGSTAEAPGLDEIIGQERATRALDFGIDMPSRGYNIYAMGPAGAGKTSTVMAFLQRKAPTRPVPAGWGYVHNFADPDRPAALQLPPGQGARLRGRVDQLLKQAADALERTFEGDKYAEQRRAVEHGLDQQRDAGLRELSAAVQQVNFDLVRTDSGLGVVPAKDGQPLTREQFGALSEEEQQGYAQNQPAAEEALERTLRQMREIEQAGQEQLAQLDREIAAATIAPLFAPLADEYADWTDLTGYLGRVQEHIALHIGDLRPHEGGEAAQAAAQPAPVPTATKSPWDRYRLNVIVDNDGLQGAPVVLETNPTYANLMGRVELRAEYGTLVTDYRYIKAGALHRANGGYLVLDARALLRQPMAWEALKQALRHQRIRMEEIGQQPGVLVAATLQPEPIPLDVKVVLIGDPSTYYTLYAYDQEFETLFKVRADFAVEMDWTAENELKIAQLIRARCEEEGLPHFDISAVARVIEYGARLVDDQRKLTTRFAFVNDLVREAAFWARRAGHELATRQDVSRAIDERIYRSNQYEERVREMITDGTIMVDVQGEAVGQVNGLAVLQLGDYAFGKPSRITARTFQGRSGVVNIEREVRLSGRIHDKGVLILNGFLGGRYAQDQPLCLSASLAFEQSYDGVDGDSASSSELYALLSSLSGLPIRQSLAVTGSINQKGEIQAIGGANAKIEGFFDVCRAMPGGLTGDQGVILPWSNVRNLMLREDVLEAVAQGQFHIYPVRTIDEGIEILTGVPAGERCPDGGYPEHTVNGLINERLCALSDKPNNREPVREKVVEVAAEQPGDAPREPDLPTDQPEPVEG